MYDFILFEHTGLKNHCKDICIIGDLLRQNNYTVAIANVTIEDECCRGCDIPIINIKTEQRHYKSTNKFYSQVIRELSGYAKNIYVGTLMTNHSMFWLINAPRDINIYMWGLRSYYLREFRIWPLHKTVIQSLWIWIYSKYNRRLKLFVSDDIIKNEFVSLGWSDDRLVIRPERMIKKLPQKDIVCTSPKKFLIIGSLRPGKRIDLWIEAFAKRGGSDLTLIIAGKAYSLNGFDRLLNKSCEKHSFIIRIDKRLDDDEYFELIKECDYLILCDEKQSSSITNGTMNEALLSGRPIIAPNYNPYSSIVDAYNVGLLYDINNLQSLIETLEIAKNNPVANYNSNLLKYQKTLLYDKIVTEFGKELKKTF